MIITAPQFEPIISRSLFARQRYRLTADWTIVLDDNLPIIFPAGFETDLASIPRLFWAIPGFSPTGPLMYGSIPHDFGYQHQYLLTPRQEGTVYPVPTQALCDRFPEKFEINVPVFVGRNQRFFDNLLAGITIEATGRVFVARCAEKMLGLFGDLAWWQYRSKGPSAYNLNSLGLPGITTSGFKL